MLKTYKTDTMPDGKRILDEQQRQRVGEVFDSMLARAELPAPKAEDFKEGGKLNAAAFTEARDAYNSNPLLEKVASIKQESIEATGGNADDAQAYYNTRIDSMKANFMRGVDSGAADPNAANRQQGIMNSLMRFPPDFIGVIKQVLLGIPFIGDSLAAMGKMVMSGFKMNFSDAKEQLTLERSMGGGATNLGIEMQGNLLHDYNNNAFVAQERPDKPIASEIRAKVASTNTAGTSPNTEISGASGADAGESATPVATGTVAGSERVH